jgi:hypothetical protein
LSHVERATDSAAAEHALWGQPTAVVVIVIVVLLRVVQGLIGDRAPASPDPGQLPAPPAQPGTAGSP